MYGAFSPFHLYLASNMGLTKLAIQNFCRDSTLPVCNVRLLHPSYLLENIPDII